MIRHIHLVLLSLLAGCVVAKDDIHEDYYVVGTPSIWQSKLGTAWRDTDPPVLQGPRYCYTAYGDVVCYSRPWPRGEDHMVGYQLPVGMAEPTPVIVQQETVVIQPDPPVIVEPLPVKKVTAKKTTKKKTTRYTKPDDVSVK